MVKKERSYPAPASLESEAKKDSHTLKLFKAWVSETKQNTHTLKLPPPKKLEV